MTPLDTSGEKPYEEFVAADEVAGRSELSALGVLRYAPPPVPLDDALAFIEAMVTSSNVDVGKSDIADHIASVVPGFRHVETGRSLDDRT
jgi:hypothetical protein